MVKEAGSEPEIWGGLRRNSYFHSHGHYGVCGKISREITLGEFGPYRYRFRSPTGADFKIRGGQKKTLHQSWNFVNLLDNQSPQFPSFILYRNRVPVECL